MNYPSYPMTSQIIRASSIEAVRQYRMTPNSTALILDENNPIVYFVSTDGTGYNNVKMFDIIPHKDPEQTTIETLMKRINELEAKVNESYHSADEHKENTRNNNGSEQNVRQSNANEFAIQEFR